MTLFTPTLLQLLHVLPLCEDGQATIYVSGVVQLYGKYQPQHESDMGLRTLRLMFSALKAESSDSERSNELQSRFATNLH
jgi:hypothetical protein